MKQADNEHVPQRSGVFRARKNGTLTFKRGPAAQAKCAKATRAQPKGSPP